MKKKNIKKLLLPLFIMAVCFISIKVPATLPNNPDESASHVLPLSDREQEYKDRNTGDH